MDRMRLDIYEKMPEGMRAYLESNGWHFSKKMCEYAVSKMKDRNGNKVDMYPKEKVDQILKTYGITLKRDIMYDATYVCNMARADFWQSSIPTEQMLALYIKDYINDEDAYDGMPFTRYYADCIGSGTPLDWEELI